MATLESPAALSPEEAPAAASRQPAVEVAHLRKTYGTLAAVDDVSFTVAEGEIF
jgi:ABC-type glutathione transport system ATPase component